MGNSLINTIQVTLIIEYILYFIQFIICITSLKASFNDYGSFTLLSRTVNYYYVGPEFDSNISIRVSIQFISYLLFIYYIRKVFYVLIIYFHCFYLPESFILFGTKSALITRNKCDFFQLKSKIIVIFDNQIELM